MNDDSLPAKPFHVPGLPPPPALQRVALPPAYQQAQEMMQRAAQEAAIPVARLAEPVIKAKGVSIAGVSVASPVPVAVPVPVSRPAPGTKTEPIIRAAPLVAPVAMAVPVSASRPAPNARTEPIAVRPQVIADPVAVAIAEPLPVSQPKPLPKIQIDLRRPKVSDEPPSTLDPSSRLW